jgi:HEAT repeat protein
MSTTTSADLLGQLLEDSVWLVQQDAIESVGTRRLQDRRKALVSLRDHKEWPVRAAVAEALARMAVPADGPVVAAIASTDPEKYARKAAAAALGAFPSSATLDTIERILGNHDEDHGVKEGALESAITIGGPRVQTLLALALTSSDEEFAEFARSIAKKVGTPAASPR